MPIRVIPSNEADAEVLVPIGIRAFADDGMNKKIFDVTKTTPEQNKRHLEWRLERHRRRVRGTGSFYFKAIDEETGAVAGYSAVMAPEADKSNTLAGVQGTDSGEKRQDELKPPDDTPKETLEFIEQLETRMKQFKRDVLGEREDVWYVPSMAVHPDFQGRGVGSKLLEHAFTILDEAGKDLYLESTPAGRKLYLKAGFEDLGSLDLTDLVGSEYALTAMLRKAKSQA